MKVLLDTNILMDAAYQNGSPSMLMPKRYLNEDRINICLFTANAATDIFIYTVRRMM